MARDHKMLVLAARDLLIEMERTELAVAATSSGKSPPPRASSSTAAGNSSTNNGGLGEKQRERMLQQLDPLDTSVATKGELSGKLETALKIQLRGKCKHQLRSASPASPSWTKW